MKNSIDEFLSYFQSLDVRLWVDGGRLHYDAPEGKLTPNLKSQLRERKSEIIEFLQKTNLRSNCAIKSIPSTPRDKNIPLSFSQQRLWFLQQLQPDSYFYNEHVALELTGVLNIEALEQSLNQIVQRHEALRTTFEVVDEQPVQIIAPSLTLPLAVVDLCHLPEAEQKTQVQQLATEQIQHPFDLLKGPLLRIELVRLKEQKHLLLVTMHHIVGDGWSFSVITRELSIQYLAFSTGKPASLPELAIQYADFTLWQRQQLQGEKLESQLSYWKQQLANAPPLLQLPTDRPRPPVQTYKGARQSFLLPENLAQSLKTITHKAQVTLFMTLLAAFKILLYRYTGQEDIVVGSSIANRNRAEIEGLIGFFVNSLVLRTDVSGDPTFEELLGRVRKVMMGAYANQDLPFEKLVQELRPERDINYNPLFQVSFILQNTPKVKFELPGLTITPFEVESSRSLFDLRLDIIENDSGLECLWEYNTDLFDADRISAMKVHFKTLLEAIAANPKQRISELPLLNQAQQHQLLSKWNQTQTDYPEDNSIHQLFEAQVEQTPDAVALLFENEQLTYHQLNCMANQLAHHLQSLGVQPEVLVGICVEPSLDLVVSLLGVLKAGGVYVPLDPKYPQERLVFMLKNSNVHIILTQEALTDKLSSQNAHILCLDRDRDVIARESVENLDSQRTLDDLAYAIYTSGSTGKPKAVLGTLRGIVNRLHWIWGMLPFGGDEICSQKTSINFVDHVAEIFSPLLKGIPLVIVPDDIRGDVPRLMSLLSEQKITRIVLVPSLLKTMLENEPQQLRKLCYLKYVFCSGEALSLTLAKEFHQKISSARLFNVYGSSEVAADVTCFEVNLWETRQRILQYFKPEVVRDTKANQETGVYQKPFTKPGMSPEMLAEKFQRSELPLYPVTVDDYYEKFSEEVLPYAIDTGSPTFIGHMTSALPDFMHDMSKMISQLNQNLVKIETSKSLIFLEREAIAILHRLVYGFSNEFYGENIQQKNRNLGIITTGGTTANISALLCARNWGLLNGNNSWELSKQSLYKILSQKGYEDIVIIGSRLMHYSVNKATSILGLGTDNIIFIDNDDNGKLDLNLLQEKIRECRRNNLYILALVGIAGTTETGEIDSLFEMGDIAQEFGIHFHVDAAWGGATIFSQKHKGKLKGIDKADSITICGHKQLYLPQGISVCLFKDPQMLNFTETTSRYQAQRDTFDVGRFTIEGSRSALSLCLHGALHIIGKRGYEILIDNGIEKAQYFSQLIQLLDPFELIMEPALNIVNYRYIPEDLRLKTQQKSLCRREIQRINQLNTQIQKEQFERGLTFVSKTTLMDAAYGEDKEIVVFRAVLSNPNTTAADLRSVLEDQLRIASQIEAKSKDKLDVSGTGDREAAVLDREIIHLQLVDDPKADVGEALEEYLKKNTIPIGKPISNTQIYILDKYGNLLPPGVTGELYVGGDGLAKGYLNLPELTQEKFIPNPFAKENGKSKNVQTERLYRTGDLARWLQDGNIEFMGRIDRQVKIRGFRIELGEIESVLNSHPQVAEAVVITTGDVPENKRLVAYVVSDDKLLSPSQLRKFLKSLLPEYMVPSTFVALDTLPLTPNGKVDRKALIIPDGEEIIRECEYVAPRTPSEGIIANIFASVLGVENIGIYDNFFELGGHSLLATQLISKLRVAFDVEIPLRTIFESPTIAQLEPTLTELRTTNSGLNLPPIQARSSSSELPLSWAQERLWFLNQLEESSATYNIPGALRISGNLDINALQKSLSEIVRRHEVLRTSFHSLNGTSIQVIHSEATMKINLVDLAQHSEQERKTLLEQQAQQEATTPFDLEIAPLIRCSLLQLDSKEYVLLLTMHHIVSDGWSIGVLIKELSSLYQAFYAGKPSPLAELPIQYADFAVWQRQWLSGKRLQTQLNYWKQQLSGVPSLLQLPTDYPRPTVQTYHGSTQSFILDRDLTQKLQTLSKKSGTTLFMTLYAGFATLLYRYSGQSDIAIGSPIANRNRSEIESLIGFFVNTLVLRSRFADNPSFENLLTQVRETTLKAYEHQDVPFEQVVEALQPQRSLAYSPLFQVMFVLQNAPMGEVKLPDVTLSELVGDRKISKFDLTLSIAETDGGLMGEWEYNSDLFDKSTIERMAAHFQNLLSAIVENPKQDVSSFNLLTTTEEKLLKDWNNNQVDYPQDKCIHRLFEQQVEKTPNHLAVVFEQEQLTYQQLNQRANQLAHYLQQIGVKPETKVGICLERSSEMVIGLLAILKAGATYIPLDPAYPQQRLEFILSDAQIPILLTDISNTNLNNISNKKLVCLTQDRENIAAQSTQNSITKVNSNNLAYIIYTSGSTGKPKGVEIAHHAVVNFLTSMQQKPGLTKEDTLLAVTTISFDIAALELYLPLITGAKLILATKEITRDGKLISELIETEQVTVMQATPATWRMLLAAGWQGYPNLKILCGGEALTNDLASQLLTSGSSVWNLYGPTETTIWSSIYQVEQTQLETSTIPIGKPINNTQIYLYDEYQQSVPIGVVGEIYIGGSGLARGYFNREQLTQSKFIHHQSGNRLYKTGDSGRYLEDGNIEYIGRIDNQVKIRGFRIELGEIEAVLSQHPLVNQAVVISSEERLVAYIVSNQEIDNIRDFVVQRLPHYMVPNLFVDIDTLPLTPNGKLDRKALPAPQQTIAKTNINPRNPIEQILVNIWSEILNIEKVSIEDNFFELGGHSLLATQVISRVRSDLNIEVPLRQLFATPTVADLAEFIQQSQQDAHPIAPPLLPVSRDRQLPISFAQERLWILDQLEGESPFYNIPAAISLVGQLNVSALQQSFQEIINRHEVLRTNFTNVDGQPVQIIHPHLEVKLPVIDLRSRCLDERTQETQRLATEQVQLAFDLTRDCLIRGCLLQLDDTEYLLLLTMHHIISDAWSLGVMTRELATLYNAFRNGQSSPLLPLEIQYADFAVWQRQWFQGDVLQQQLDFWKQQLGTNLPVLQLPTSENTEKIPTNKLAEHTFLIPGDLAESIYSLNRQEGVTLFMTLLAAFNILLQRYSNQDDIVVGTDVANRNRKEIEALIGFFINILVLRNDLKGNPTFRELLGRVRQVTLDAYAHQDLPFAELVKALQPNRGVNSTPLFQVLFVLQNVPQSSLELPELTIKILETQQEIAKFDIALFLTETKQGIAGKWQYKEDIFEGNLIAKMSDNFQTLLENIVNQPDARINDLEILSEVEKQKQTQQKQQRKNIKRKKFINAKPKAVNFSQSNLIQTSYLNAGEKLPLVITPVNNNIDIIDWAKNNREFLENKLIESGGILFRNFSISSPEDFEKLAQAICPKLFENYGDLPRTGVSGKVYGSTPYPSEQAILFHNESSHMHCYPQKIWFSCMQPAESRGETPIVDCRKLLQLLPGKLRTQFEQKQLMYVRNYTEGLDVSWQDFFGTTNKKEVEYYCYQAAINFEWKFNGGLKTSQIRPAIIKHPQTGESVFFNQLLLHHMSCLQADVQEHMLSLFGEENLPRHVYYGDGSSIENSVVAEILAICREIQMSFSWQQGDVLMLDNILTSHGRNPYVGSRKIVVAMGDMISNQEIEK